MPHCCYAKAATAHKQQLTCSVPSAATSISVLATIPHMAFLSKIHSQLAPICIMAVQVSDGTLCCILVKELTEGKAFGLACLLVRHQPVHTNTSFEVFFLQQPVCLQDSMCLKLT